MKFTMSTQSVLVLVTAVSFAVTVVFCVDRVIVLFANYLGCDLSSLGQAGDMFGFGNFVIATLALYGVWSTFLMQREQVDLQKVEIKRLEEEAKAREDESERRRKLEDAESRERQHQRMEDKLFQLLAEMRAVENSHLIVEIDGKQTNVFTKMASQLDARIQDAKCSTKGLVLESARIVCEVHFSFVPAIIRWIKLLELYLELSGYPKADALAEENRFCTSLIRSVVTSTNIKVMIALRATETEARDAEDTLLDIMIRERLQGTTGIFHSRYLDMVPEP